VNEQQKVRFADALERMSGDCDLLAAMASMVAEDAPDVVNDLRKQVATGEMQQAAATAHKLKGMLSTFETDGPVLELEELILAARQGQVQETASQFKIFDRRITGLLDEIASISSTS
jgi:polyhydroxyalkanoate synthesis regulator phasin